MQQVKQEIGRWLERVVIGLELCPFAAGPWTEQRVRVQVTECADQAGLLQCLYEEIQLLEETPVGEIETTLLVPTRVLQSFDDFNQFLDLIDRLLFDQGWQGVFQVASFHPQYCFQGEPSDAPGNLTNRSPYPVLHILREETLQAVLSAYPDPQTIPLRNIKKMEALGAAEQKALFPYLFTE